MTHTLLDSSTAAGPDVIKVETDSASTPKGPSSSSSSLLYSFLFLCFFPPAKDRIEAWPAKTQVARTTRSKMSSLGILAPNARCNASHCSLRKGCRATEGNKLLLFGFRIEV